MDRRSILSNVLDSLLVQMGNNSSREEDEDERLRDMVREVLDEEEERSYPTNQNEILHRVLDLLEQNKRNKTRGRNAPNVDDLAVQLQSLMSQVNQEAKKQKNRNRNNTKQEKIIEMLSALGARPSYQPAYQKPGPKKNQAGQGSHQEQGASKKQFESKGAQPKRFHDREYMKPNSDGKGPFDNLGPGQEANRGRQNAQNRGRGDYQNKGRGDFHNKGRCEFQGKTTGDLRNNGHGKNKEGFENKGPGNFQNKKRDYSYNEESGEYYEKNTGEFQNKGRGSGQFEGNSYGGPQNKGRGYLLDKGRGEFHNQNPGQRNYPDAVLGMNQYSVPPPLFSVEVRAPSYNQGPGLLPNPNNYGQGHSPLPNQGQGNFTNPGHQNFLNHGYGGNFPPQQGTQLPNPGQRFEPTSDQGYNYSGYPVTTAHGKYSWQNPKLRSASESRNANQEAQKPGLKGQGQAQQPKNEPNKGPKKPAQPARGKEGVLKPDKETGTTLTADVVVDSDDSTSSALAPGVIKKKRANNKKKKTNAALKKASSMTNLAATEIQATDDELIDMVLEAKRGTKPTVPIAVKPAVAAVRPVVAARTTPVPEPRKKPVAPIVGDAEPAVVSSDAGGEKVAPPSVEAAVETVAPSESVPLQLFVGDGFKEHVANEMDADSEINDVMLIAKAGGTIITCTPATLGELRAFKQLHPFAEVIVVRSDHD